MALGTSWTNIASKTITISGTTVEFYVDAYLKSQSVTNNKSVVGLRLRYYFQYYLSSYNTDFYLTGAGWLGEEYRSWSTDESGTMMTSEVTVSHNSDGTGSFTASGGYQFGGLGVSATTFTSSSVTLPTIPRASVPSMTPNPVTLSAATNTVTVSTNRKSTSFTHGVTCTIGSFTQTKQGVTDSTTFDIPDSILADFDANSTTLTGTVYVTTYNGDANLGTKSATLTAKIDTTQECPVIGTVTLTDTNAAAAAIESAGTYIKYASDLSASIVLSVSGSYTQLASATVVCGTTSQTYTLSGTSQTISFTYSKLDNDSITIYVTDERGTTVSHTESWTLIPYRDITVTGIVDRTTETGDEISFTLDGACFAGSFGGATNTVTVSYKWKLRANNTYTTGGTTWTFTPSGSGETTYQYTNTVTGFDYDKQYDVIFTVTDMFTSAETRAIQLTTGIPVYGNGEDFFAVYGDLYIHDRTDPTDFWKLTPTSHVGQVKEADWIKASNPAIDTAMTDPLTLEEGTYIITFKRAYTSSTAFSMHLDINGSYADYRYGGTGEFFTGVLTVASQTTIVVKSTQSASCSFSNLERGYLKAVKII